MESRSSTKKSTISQKAPLSSSATNSLISRWNGVEAHLAVSSEVTGFRFALLDAADAEATSAASVTIIAAAARIPRPLKCITEFRGKFPLPKGMVNRNAKNDRVGVLTAVRLANREAAWDGLSANETSTTAAM